MNPTISCVACDWTMTALPWALEAAANSHAHATLHPGVLIRQGQAWGRRLCLLDALNAQVRAARARN